MKHLDEYPNEIIASFYKNYELYQFTCAMKNMPKDTVNGILRKQIWSGQRYDTPFNKRFWLDIYNSNKQRAMLNETNASKRQRLEFEIKFNEIFDEILVWFCKGYEIDDKIGIVPCDKIESIKWTKEITQKCIDEGYDPEFTWEKLTINDKINLQYGHAPRLAMLDFIWETLQYCNDNEINKLIKFAENGYVSNWKQAEFFVVRNKNKKKQVKDVETGIVYESQNAAAEAIGKTKSYISKHKERFITMETSNN